MRRWIFALPVNIEVWAWSTEAQDYLPRLVTEAEAAAYVTETQRALAHWRAVAPSGLTPYRPPILVEHERRGERLGSIADARLAGSGARRGVYLLADWTPQGWARVQSGRACHVSISTTPHYRDGDGTTFQGLIDELSLTEHPRLKNIGTIQDTLALRLADALNTRGTLMTPEEMIARLEAQDATIAELKMMVEQLVAEKVDLADPPADPPADATKEEAMMMALSDRIIKGLTPKIEQQVVTTLKGMRLGDGATLPPAGKTPPQDPLAKAKAEGKTGLAALSAAFNS